ncbi:MAG: PaaI family thioesterase, partial [Gaiellaceae bacterium]
MSDPWFARMYELYNTSPVHRLFGMQLESLAPGEATVVFTPRPELINASGVVHGGILATIVDSAILQAVRTLIGPDDRPTTLELKLNYVSPGTGPSFRCVGKAVRVG